MRHYVATTAPFAVGAEPALHCLGYYSISAPNPSWSSGALVENASDYCGYLCTIETKIERYLQLANFILLGLSALMRSLQRLSTSLLPQPHTSM